MASAFLIAIHLKRPKVRHILINVCDLLPPAKKKEPPYSRVTAREPLENLLRRQAEQTLLGDSFDPNYASVDYDQMKVSKFPVVHDTFKLAVPQYFCVHQSMVKTFSNE